MSNSSTPTTADFSDEDFLTTQPAPAKKKYTTAVYKLGPLKITRKKEVRMDKKPSMTTRVMQKMFSCNGNCAAAACAD